MSLPQGGFEGGGQASRRRMVFVAVVSLLALIAWGYLVVSWGGGEERAEAGTDGTVERTASSPDSLREPEAVPDGNARAAPEELTPVKTPPGHDAGTHDHPERAEREPGSHDPLGTGASSGDLAEVERERVRFAAAEFVSAAYGYSGGNPDGYNQEVGETVVWPVFYESEGAGEIRRYAWQVGRTGTRSAAELIRFEFAKATPELAAGFARFETGGGRDPRTGELTGSKVSYRQPLTFARSGPSWKVKAAGEVRKGR